MLGCHHCSPLSWEVWSTACFQGTGPEGLQAQTLPPWKGLHITTTKGHPTLHDSVFSVLFFSRHWLRVACRLGVLHEFLVERQTSTLTVCKQLVPP